MELLIIIIKETPFAIFTNGLDGFWMAGLCGGGGVEPPAGLETLDNVCKAGLC